jgi:hypothetical protein
MAMGSGGVVMLVPICWRRGRDKRADAPSGGATWVVGPKPATDNFTSGAPWSAGAASQQPRAVVADRSGTTTLEGGD